MACSTRGTPATLPAITRPLSNSTTTFWLRSVRYVRTMGLPIRAVARQSMRRKSSFTPYSRRLSNSVPAPRPLAVRSPSWSDRARLIFSSASARERNGGYTRSSPGSSTRPWRPTSPSGPRSRRPMNPRWMWPRRTGSMVVRTSTVALPATVTVARLSAARSDGGSSSEKVTRTPALVGLVSRHTRGASRPWVAVGGNRASPPTCWASRWRRSLRRPPRPAPGWRRPAG